MGFFSWNCKGCGHPLLSGYAADPMNRWMIDGVAVTCKGSVIKGGYDGYGRLDGVEINRDVAWRDGGGSVNEPDVYHLACWELMGRPAKYEGGSQSARDQGYFFARGTHTVPRPTNKEQLKCLKEASDILERKRAVLDQEMERKWERERKAKADAEVGKLVTVLKPAKRILRKAERSGKHGKGKTDKR